jgi:putative transposase
VFELASALKKENPDRSAAQVRRILHAQLGWAPDERTLQRMFIRTGLTALRAPVESAVFGRFEAGRPNEIWTGDALHGPRIGNRKTYLFAFIDDQSRAIVGHRWGFAEDTVRLAAALRPALAARGVPEYVYVEERVGVRRLVVAAGLRETRDQAGPLRTRPAAGSRENRTVLPHRQQRVRRRDRLRRR